MEKHEQDELAKQTQKEVGEILSSIQPKNQLTPNHAESFRGLEMACLQMLVSMAIFATGLMLPLPFNANPIFLVAGSLAAHFGVRKWIRHAPRDPVLWA